MKFRNVFVCPVVGRNIREEFAALRFNRTRILAGQLIDHLTLTIDDVFQFSHVITEVFDFLSHADARIRYVVALADLEGDTGIDHVFTAADGAADGEGGIFVRFVEGTESTGVSAAIVAIAKGEIPFVIGIEVLRMEGCQSSCTGTDAVDAVIQFIDFPTQVI